MINSLPNLYSIFVICILKIHAWTEQCQKHSVGDVIKACLHRLSCCLLLRDIYCFSDMEITNRIVSKKHVSSDVISIGWQTVCTEASFLLFPVDFSDYLTGHGNYSLQTILSFIANLVGTTFSNICREEGNRVPLLLKLNFLTTTTKKIIRRAPRLKKKKGLKEKH